MKKSQTVFKSYCTIISHSSSPIIYHKSRLDCKPSHHFILHRLQIFRVIKRIRQMVQATHISAFQPALKILSNFSTFQIPGWSRWSVLSDSLQNTSWPYFCSEPSWIFSSLVRNLTDLQPLCQLRCFQWSRSYIEVCRTRILLLAEHYSRRNDSRYISQLVGVKRPEGIEDQANPSENELKRQSGCWQ